MTLRTMSKITAILTLATIVGFVIWGGYTRNWTWTGLSARTVPKSPYEEYYPMKTAWDWMQLLMIPFFIAIIGFWFNQAMKRDEAARALEGQREEGLRKYFDSMTELLLGTGQGTSGAGETLNTKPSPTAQTLARARTLTVLPGLDGKRKGQLLRFLLESKLIARSLAGGAKLEDQGFISLDGFDLRGADLREVSLKGINLSGTDLRKADLTRSDLYLSGIDEETRLDQHWRFVWQVVNYQISRLQKADLHGAYLRERFFPYTDLRSADLREADLRGALFFSADLRGADLRGARLQGADMTYVKISRWTRIEPKWRRVCEIAAGVSTAVDLRKADLREACLKVASLEKRDLREADLTDANLSGSNLEESDLRNSKIYFTKLDGARLTKAKLSGASVLMANLSEAILDDADLTGLSISHSNLKSAKLRRANLEGSDLESCDLRGADLTGATLKQAKLRQVELSSAVLTDADLSGADLSFAKLDNANLDHANFSGATISEEQLRSAASVKDATMPNGTKSG